MNHNYQILYENTLEELNSLKLDYSEMKRY